MAVAGALKRMQVEGSAVNEIYLKFPVDKIWKLDTSGRLRVFYSLVLVSGTV